MVMEVSVGCPECKTSRTKPLDEARETIREHNENMHDGEPVAGIRVRVGDEIKHFPHPKDATQEVRDKVIELLRERREE